MRDPPGHISNDDWRIHECRTDLLSPTGKREDKATFLSASAIPLLTRTRCRQCHSVRQASPYIGHRLCVYANVQRARKRTEVQREKERDLTRPALDF